MAAVAPSEAPPVPPASEGEMTREAMEQQPFVDRHWLYYNRLHRETVLEYFAQSRFYDRASCNEELRMQGATDVRAEHLKGMAGIQYLAEEVPGPTPDAPIFVIQKLLRSAPEQEPQVLDVYYVLNGMIYQAPTIFSVLNARLRRCAHLLNKAQKTLRKAVGFEYHQQAGAHPQYPHYPYDAAAAAAAAAGGGGGSADLYSLKRGRGRGRGRGGGGRRGKKQQQQMQQMQHYAQHPYPPMMLAPPPLRYPPLRGEDLMMVDIDSPHAHGHGGPVPPSPLPSPHAPHGHGGPVPPPPSPGAGGEESGQPPFQQELPSRLISRYPGPSPLTDVMTQAHPEAASAVDKVVAGVVDEYRTTGGNSTSSSSTSATALTGAEGAGAAAAATTAPEVTNKEEI